MASDRHSRWQHRSTPTEDLNSRLGVRNKRSRRQWPCSSANGTIVFLVPLQNWAAKDKKVAQAFTLELRECWPNVSFQPASSSCIPPRLVQNNDCPTCCVPLFSAKTGRHKQAHAYAPTVKRNGWFGRRKAWPIWREGGRRACQSEVATGQYCLFNSHSLLVSIRVSDWRRVSGLSREKRGAGRGECGDMHLCARSGQRQARLRWRANESD